MLLIFIYHYFLAHGMQYLVHYITHHKKCPIIFSKNHILHHGNPVKITWFGQSTFSSEQTNTATDLYYIVFIFYFSHIYYFFYDNMLAHFFAFSTIAFTFLCFHGMCHYLTREQQQKIPIINTLFFHHYKHHLNTSINLGFGDVIFDYFLNTLDLSPVDHNDPYIQKRIDYVDPKYFQK